MDVIDTKELGTTDGFDIRAYLVPDTELDPRTNGIYSDEAIAAWNRGDWHYVSVIVTASRDDVELGDAAIGGCEYGDFPDVADRINPLNGSGRDFANGYGPGLISEAVAAAREALSHMST